MLSKPFQTVLYRAIAAAVTLLGIGIWLVAACFLVAILVLIALFITFEINFFKNAPDKLPEHLYVLDDIRWALLDKHGKLTLWDPDMEALSPVQNGLITYCESNPGQEIYYYGAWAPRRGGIIDLQGHRHRFNNRLLDSDARFSEGLIPLRVQPPQRPSKYIIGPGSKRGTKDLPLEVTTANPPSTESATEKEPEYFYADKNGKQVIKRKFYAAKSFSEGLAAVVTEPIKHDEAYTANYYRQTKARWGYIDKTGKLVIPAKFTHAGEFHAGRAVVSQTDSERDKAVIDKAGQVIFSADKSYSLEPFSKDGFAVFQNYCQSELPAPSYGLIDTKGQIRCSGVRFRNFYDGMGLLFVEPGQSLKFANSDGKIVLTLPSVKQQDNFAQVMSEGFMAVPTGSYRTYQTKVHPAVSCASPFLNRTSYTFVDKHGQFLKCNLGNRVIIQTFPFSEGYAVVKTAVPRISSSKK